MDNEDSPIDDETTEAIHDIMKPRVVDGEVFVSATGIREMILEYAHNVAKDAIEGNTCAHGVVMGGTILDNLDVLMDYCEYVSVGSGDLVPDTIPDDIMGE